MSRSVRKAIENAKHKKEHELRLSDEGIGDVATTYPELCKSIVPGVGSGSNSPFPCL